MAQLHQLDWRVFSDHPDLYEKDPTVLLEEILSPYRALYGKYDLKGFLQIIDWLDVHKHEVKIKPCIVHQDFHANNVFLCADGHLVVIDWTQFAISDHRIDLCWTLLIMGDLGNPAWKKQILKAYASSFNQPIENLEYFNVIVYMKLLASAVISFSFNPKKIGLQSGSIDAIKSQLPIYKQLVQRIQNIADIKVPELENILNTI